MRCTVYWDGELTPFLNFDDDDCTEADLPKPGDEVLLRKTVDDDMVPLVSEPVACVCERRSFDLLYVENAEHTPWDDESDAAFVHAVFLKRRG